MDDETKENIKEYQSEQIGKEMQNEINKMTKMNEKIVNGDSKLQTKPSKTEIAIETNEHHEIVFNLQSHAFKYYDKSYIADVNMTFDHFKTESEAPIQNLLKDNLNEYKGMKFMACIHVLFNKFSGETKIETKPYIRTKVITVTNISEISMYEIYD